MQGKETRFLGRQLLQPINSRLHSTGPDFLKHFSRNPVHHSYGTECATAYNATGAPSTTASARRFPRTRPDPASGPVPLDTTTTDWFPRSAGQGPSSAPQPSTRVLAVSQQPYPKHNSWNYSYKGRDRVYPPYIEPIRLPHVDNVFNRYGADFAATASAAARAAEC